MPRLVAALLALARTAAADLPCAAKPETCVPIKTATGDLMMPAVALGTWRGSYGDCADNDYSCVRAKAKASVGDWLDLGGRHIDGANDYRTQVEIGEAVAAPTASRSSSRRRPGALGMQATIQCHEDNLQMLGQYGVNTSGYVDLLLIHFPFAIKPECYGVTTSADCAASPYYDPGTKVRQETWKAMELLVKLGKAVAVGISDYNATHIEETLEVAEVPVALHQVEWNPKKHDEDMLKLCQKHGIQLQAWSPLGGAEGSVLGDPTVKKIADARRLGSGHAQVVLQRGVAVVTGTDNKDHMASDLDLFGFALGDDEVAAISALQ
ncbi:oxidoreductase [Aureococcus anophagefferens]|nr:oxidoreductase [Aureococcus anophagefferens]